MKNSSTALSHIAQVVPELSLDKVFDYQIPEALAEAAQPGAKVRVPFGRRHLTGFIVALREGTSVPAESLKAIDEVLGERPVLSPQLLELAHWMAEYYCAPLGAALKTLLPAVVRRAASRHKTRLWVAPRTDIAHEQLEKILGTAKKQREAWQFLQAHGPGWLADLCDATGTTQAVWRALEGKGLAAFSENVQERDPLGQIPNAAALAASDQPLTLNLEQAAALALIEGELRAPQPRPVLLAGVTGSGKTEVYLQAIARVLEAGKTALVLVPEIVLTPQTVEQFRRRFLGKARLAVLHSHLSQGERHDQWHRIRDGKVEIVIGARSAVFAPLPRLGLVVVDEEHESSYKQEEAPRYHARDVAVMRGYFEKIPVVLGSATPSLESRQNALEGKYVLARLTQRVEAVKLPVMHVVDIRKEFKRREAKSPARLLSVELTEAIRARLERKEQVIIFLNRRGYATALQCPNCGHTQMCPHCSIPLTYHRHLGMLCCHLCDTRVALPERCPECGFEGYRYGGVGTERLEETLAAEFPDATVARMDSDTMRAKDAYARTLGAFARGEIDILTGTQMIAKGLHFPRVTCVGVIHADLALQLPDFRASERVFQLLMQVAGRSGRGDVTGEVFVQTRTPFHPAIQFARHHDYDGFAQQELEFRKSLGYPPFTRTILLEWQGRSEEKTRYLAEAMARQIIGALQGLAEGTGPAPAPIYKIKDSYRQQLFLRTAKILPAVRALRPLAVDAPIPEDTRLIVDVDPVSML